MFAPRRSFVAIFSFSATFCFPLLFGVIFLKPAVELERFNAVRWKWDAAQAEIH